MKQLLRYLKQYKKESILGPLFKLLEASFELFVPLVMASIVDIGIFNRDTSHILKMGGVLVLLGAIGLTCALTAQYYAAKASVGFGTALRHDLFAHLQTLSYGEIDTIGTSTMITRMTSDINQVQSGVNLFLRLFLRSPFIVVGAMIMAFTVNIRAAFVFVVTIPLLSVVVFGVMLVSIPLYKKVQKKLDAVMLKTRENLTGARVIRAFQRQEEEIEDFDIATSELMDVQLFVGKISGMLNPVTYIIVNGATLFLLWIGALEVFDGIITQGEVMALVNYMSQILVELVKLANLIINLTKSIACANRISDIMAEQSSLNEYNKEWIDCKTSWQENQEEFSQLETHRKQDNRSDKLKVEFSELKNKENINNEWKKDSSDLTQKKHLYADKVVFENVTFSYKNASESSLTDISFQVKKGQTVGIIGGTGSGKSSLVNLIPRFYEIESGKIFVDGIETKDYSFEQLRGKIGIVPQKAVLFHGTIRENMKWGKKDATDEEIYRALEIAQAREFVEEKEKGLDTIILQGGKNLSGGQRQRLTIARALVAKPEILILDDSCSALDYATDAKLRKALTEMEHDMTVFIVSQRTSSIRYADQIIVLEDGKMEGIGTHEQLLSSCEIYQEIHASQGTSPMKMISISDNDTNINVMNAEIDKTNKVDVINVKLDKANNKERTTKYCKGEKK